MCGEDGEFALCVCRRRGWKYRNDHWILVSRGTSNAAVPGSGCSAGRVKSGQIACGRFEVPARVPLHLLSVVVFARGAAADETSSTAPCFCRYFDFNINLCCNPPPFLLTTRTATSSVPDGSPLQSTEGLHTLITSNEGIPHLIRANSVHSFFFSSKTIQYTPHFEQPSRVLHDGRLHRRPL